MINDIDKSRQQLVVMDNDFIQKSKYNLTANQQKLISYIISRIKPADIELGWFVIDISTFCNICGIDRKHFYNDFRDMIDNLDNKAIWITTEEKTFKFRWFIETEILHRSGIVRVRLNSNLEKYLLGLDRNFTQFELYNVLPLKSKYSNRLYQLFKSYAFQRRKEIELEDLKAILCAEKYDNFKDFRKRVLEKAVEEINFYTDIVVSYDTIKKGRKVYSILFHINPKEAFDAYIAYKNTLNQLNKQNKQIEGQIGLFDKREEEF